ncbi:MAG: N-6 DNA methylase [Nitrosomonas sp.]|nr:N-6 DNA methylase [Nitrosomonas sp.]
MARLKRLRILHTKPIAEGIWDLMSELGFSGGKVLDPSAGVGVFGAVAPVNAAVDAIELNETSGRINGLVNDGAGYSTTVSAFEKVAANTPDESYDAIVTNVPFGGVADRGGNQLLDNRYQKEPLQNYFILRSLEKLKPGGLAVFITPPRCVSGKGGKEEDLRVKASFMAEFLGAYRLPNSVFGTASADTMTDVIAFRKYSRETLDKIAELREQSPQTLIDANVQWQEFIEGQYFIGEGKRFILGEFVPKDPNKFRDVDRVINPANVAEIGRMLKRFPGTRINWELLGLVETSPIIYRDGDTVTQSGQTLQMQNGRWVAMARTEESVDMAKMAGNMVTPYKAFENKITWADAIKYFDYMTGTSQALDIPAWARGAINEIKRLSDEGERGKYWNAGVVGMSVAQVLEERLSEEVGVKYVDEYTALSDAMQRASTIAKGRPSSIGGRIKDGLLAIGNHYQKKTGFSAVWRGDVQQDVTPMEITADSSFEGLRYKTRSAWVTLDDAKGIYGDDFDPVGDQAWCVSPDGKSVTRADDYYVGNYAEFLKRVDAEIAAATDDKVRDKLLRQKLDADSRVDRIDVSKLTFNLFTPYVTHEEKAEFMRRFVHPAAVVVFDEKTGEKRVDIDIPGSKLTDREKLINRIGDYMKNGTITLGGAKLDMEKQKALQELRRMVNTANEQFNGWVRGNSVIMRRLEGIASDPTKLRFRQVEDSSPMKIQGMSDLITPHGYQFAEIRRQSREFGGINGFGVGLGKTITALAAVQYAQSIGVKKKTFFVVPNSVLSNWRKEAARAYTNQDDMLFVGLRVNKADKALVNSTNFDADLTAIMENRHSKIFMTMEAFERIRLRDETISGMRNSCVEQMPVC